MSDFMDRYDSRARELNSVFCVGLDPTPAHVPWYCNYFEPTDGPGVPAIKRYLKDVIDMAATRVPVVKPQYAYYGALGPAGIEMLIEIIAYAKSKGLLVILDGKRADIGETMKMYGREVFDRYGVDLCTFVPYLGPTFLPRGQDTNWLPWLKKGHGVIPMIFTSNPESESVQMLKLETGKFLYEAMAEMVLQWSEIVADITEGAGTVAGVVGATYPEQAVEIRKITGPSVPFLIPGYGAQGGGAEGAVAGFPETGELSGFVNSSRGITLQSWFDKTEGRPRDGKDPLGLVEAAIDAANAELNAALTAKLGRNPYEAAPA